MVAGNNGAGLTVKAFGLNPVLGAWFPWVLMGAVILFAFSTMISWSYYGERCWTNLFGQKSSLSYKVLFLMFVVLGSIVTATNVLEFGDVMILLMAFPNILGLYFLGGLVKNDLAEYEELLQAGDLQIAGTDGDGYAGDSYAEDGYAEDGYAEEVDLDDSYAGDDEEEDDETDEDDYK